MVNQIRQRQKRLSGDEIAQLIAKYKTGSTTYELAAQFGCHRTTVSEHLKANGVRMRRKPLTEGQVDKAVRLHESGLSLAKVSQQIGADTETIRARLRKRGVVMRDAHYRGGG
jgi:lambda repressor-like predicted transcriptional regulator